MLFLLCPMWIKITAVKYDIHSAYSAWKRLTSDQAREYDFLKGKTKANKMIKINSSQSLQFLSTKRTTNDYTNWHLRWVSSKRRLWKYTGCASNWHLRRLIAMKMTHTLHVNSNEWVVRARSHAHAYQNQVTHSDGQWLIRRRIKRERRKNISLRSHTNHTIVFSEELKTNPKNMLSIFKSRFKSLFFGVNIGEINLRKEHCWFAEDLKKMLMNLHRAREDINCATKKNSKA